jgi:hypothetical protein
MYNALDESQRATFEADANALENTTIIGKDRTKMNGLDAIKSVNFINGETPKSNLLPHFPLKFLLDLIEVRNRFYRPAVLGLVFAIL